VLPAMLTNTPACGDAGRAMFYEFVGRYFSAEPRLEKLPMGTACGRCGCTEAQLWVTSYGQASCIAQQAIVRKRAGRKSPEEACAPATDTAGMVYLGEGAFVIAGPHVARITTRLLPDLELPRSLSVEFPRPGVIREMLKELVENPPRPPFVAIRFGKSSAFEASVTHHESRVIVCGPQPLILEAPRIRELVELFAGMKPGQIAEALALRNRLASGEARDDDGGRLADLKASHLRIAAAFRRLPSPGSAAAAMLKHLVASNSI